MLARDIMTMPVVAVAEDETLYSAARLLIESNVSAAPVLNSSRRLVGIVSEADLIGRLALPESQVASSRRVWLRNSLEAAAMFVRTHARLIRDVMTRPVVTAVEDSPVDELATLILGKGIKRLPIVRGEHVVGIVSRVDLLRMLYSTPPADIGSGVPQAGRSRQEDLDLQNIARQVLENLPWHRAWPVEATVLHGAVHLWGRVPDDLVRQAYIMAAADIPGNREVLDHMHVIPSLLHQAGGVPSR